MKKILLSGVAFAALVAAPAMAADLPARAPVYKASPVAVAAYNWSGFYVGANVGGGWARKCWFFNPTVVDEGCHTATGLLAGGQIGINWQTSNWVFGLEASGDWANLSGSNVSVAFPTVTNRSRIDALGLFTGRIGMAWDSALLYAKGGAAVVRDRYDAFTTATPAVFNSASETRWGWTVGAGIEYGFSPNWSAAVEYDYVALGTKTLAFTTTTGFACTAPCTDDIKQNLHAVTLRLNYRFGGGPVVARY